MYLHENDTYTEHNHDKIHDNKHVTISLKII